jgi:hypothetical protein
LLIAIYENGQITAILRIEIYKKRQKNASPRRSLPIADVAAKSLSNRHNGGSA